MTNAARRLGVAAALAIVLVSAGCTQDDGPAPRTLVDPAPTTERSDPAPSTPPVEQPAVIDTALELALLAVPARAEYVSFTDVAAVRERLGYADLTGQSPTRDRFDFWERARADGAMLTGTRLYDASSVMAIDYGWTAEDVDWEVDFSSAETGCAQAMLCGRASGYVLALRRSLEWRDVLESLDRNGFAPVDGEPGVWSGGGDDAPFDDVLLVPDLHLVAGGNDEGLRRLAEVAFGGADSVADRAAPLVADAAEPESAYLDLTGCVTLAEALGPDATDDDTEAFFRGGDAADLADATAYAVLLAGRSSAEVVTTTDAAVTDVQLAARQDLLDRWQSVQAAVPFSDIATATVDRRGAGEGEREGERVSVDVRSAAGFIAMVVTHDAPWALCSSSPPA